MDNQPSEDSWQSKVTAFHLNITGLNRLYTTNDLTSQRIVKMHTVMVLPVLIFVTLSVCGIFVHSTSPQSRLSEICLLYQYGLIFGTDLVLYYTLIVKRHLFAECLRNTTDRSLRCLFGQAEELLWRKHKKSYSFFLIFIMLSYYGGCTITGIVSPIVRFGLQTNEQWYALLPLWYPVDVMSSRGMFWCAVLYESVLLWYTIFLYVTMDVMFLCILMTAVVKFDSLSCFLEKTVENRHFSSPTRRKRMTESGMAPEKGNRSCLLPGRNGGTRKIVRFNPEDLERLKRGIDDWVTLRRHTNQISKLFSPYFSAKYFTALTLIAIISYAAVSELRHCNGSRTAFISESTRYFFYIVSILCLKGIMCYCATLIQEVPDDIRHSLWKTGWYAEQKEFQKLFLNFNLPLTRSLRMKAFSFCRVNLETLLFILNRSVSFFLFLLELSSAK